MYAYVCLQQHAHRQLVACAAGYHVSGMPQHLKGPPLTGRALQVHNSGIERNLHLAQDAATALGDIPLFLSPALLEHGADERAVVLFVSYLCGRLLDVSREHRAAHTIQSLFRKRKAQQPGMDWCADAAVVLHSFVLRGVTWLKQHILDYAT